MWRHWAGQTPFGPGTELNLLFDKWHLGPARLLNFFALVVLVIRFGPRIAARLPLGPLQTLGRASLPVFCAHVVVALLLLAAIGDSVGQTPLWAETVVLSAVLAGLYVVALLSNLRARKKREREYAQPFSVGTAGWSTATGHIRLRSCATHPA
jgi:hypothetical protein